MWPMNAKEWFSDFARGTTLGTGMLPGVSVGTVGIIVNVYDRLLNAIDGLRKKSTFKDSLIRLIPIALGTLIATALIVLFWKKVGYRYFPFPLIAALAGFVVGALPIMTKELTGKKLDPMDIGKMLMGFIVAAGIGVAAYLSAADILPIDLNFSSPIDTPFQNWWIFIVVFIVGFFAAVSCLIPGISGSMVMFIFGLYNPIIGLFLSERDAQGNVIHPSIFSDTSKLAGGVVVIGVLLLGMLIGFLATSKFMKTMLEKYRRGTFTVIIGFVLGSVVSMFLNNDMYFVYHDPAVNAWWQFAIGGVLFVFVGVVTFFLVRRSLQNAKETLPESGRH